MNLQCRETSDTLIVTLEGKLDESSATGLPARLTQLCDGKNQSNIVIDLTDCNVDCSLGYGALVAFRLSPAVLKRHVSIQNALPEVVTGMRALRFEKLFKLV